jgi:hypothetical protein
LLFARGDFRRSFVNDLGIFDEDFEISWENLKAETEFLWLKERKLGKFDGKFVKSMALEALEF